MTIVPFERMAAYVHESVLHRVAPDVAENSQWNSVGAVVRAFQWKPAFDARGEDSEPDLDWGGTFFEDAEVLIELLALMHEAPVVCLATVPYCLHRTALGVLGEPKNHGGFSWKRWVRTFDTSMESSDVNMGAIEKARKAFRERNSELYRDCAPVIARLVEALARSGRFRIDDRILDVVIALERMYRFDQGELSFKLKTKAACFLETARAERLRVFRDVDERYRMRLAMFPGGRKCLRRKNAKKRSRRDSRLRGGRSSSWCRMGRLPTGTRWYLERGIYE